MEDGEGMEVRETHLRTKRVEVIRSHAMLNMKWASLDSIRSPTPEPSASAPPAMNRICVPDGGRGRYYDIS
jgi:hypothetical protein